MCGIAGYWGSFTADALRAAVAKIAHRGPDDLGTFEDPDAGVALAHVRLSILELSELGHQPMLSDDGKVVLVFNGEIYNFAELRRQLEARGVSFRGRSDTEVLLQLYLAEGMDMLPRLNGIFAFALYDARIGELLLARDHMGIKPLYYSASEQGLAFASEMKGLLPLVGSIGEVDEAAVDRYLTFQWCPGEGTPARGVRKMDAGTLMRVRRGQVVERRAWYRLPQTLYTPGKISSEEHAVRSVREALREAVHLQMVADVPVGAFLSGGLDSSAVVAFARERAPDIRCFTIEARGGSERGQTDDLPYARDVAAHLQVKLEVVSVDASLIARDLEEMVWQLDEPLADPAALNVLYICRLARQQGIKVLLSGVGGDDLFTGYRRHLALRLEDAWSWMPKWARARLGQLARTLDQRAPAARRIARAFRDADGSEDERLVAYFAWARREDLLPLYSPRMRHAIQSVRADQPLMEFLGKVDARTTRLDRMLALEQRFFLSDHNLIYTDKMSMATGVEVRVPFLDPHLVELAARIPDKYKQNGRIGKWVLKKAMEPLLPRHAIYRPKTGFGAPLRRWMRHELRDTVQNLLSPESLEKRGLFDPAAVQHLISDNESGRRDAAYTLFSLLCIEMWSRRFMDCRSGVPAASHP